MHTGWRRAKPRLPPGVRAAVAIHGLKLRALDVWARLQARLAAFPPSARAREPFARRALVLLAKFLLVAVLPFFVLVRVSMFLYSHYAYPTWLALAAGVGCTLVVLTAYAAWISRRLTGRVPLLVLARRVALPVALAYCGYALLFLSSANAKTERVRSYYTTLHPLLRLALSTWILLDRDAVITDLARRPEDYAGLGLAVNDGSLHLVQRDGYVHAADLRTGGRGWIRNGLVRLYFWGMGFGTLRHAGRRRGATVDHLHVELPLP